MDWDASGATLYLCLLLASYGILPLSAGLHLLPFLPLDLPAAEMTGAACSAIWGHSVLPACLPALLPACSPAPAQPLFLQQLLPPFPAHYACYMPSPAWDGGWLTLPTWRSFYHLPCHLFSYIYICTLPYNLLPAGFPGGFWIYIGGGHLGIYDYKHGTHTGRDYLGGPLRFCTGACLLYCTPATPVLLTSAGFLQGLGSAYTEDHLPLLCTVRTACLGGLHARHRRTTWDSAGSHYRGSTRCRLPACPAPPPAPGYSAAILLCCCQEATMPPHSASQVNTCRTLMPAPAATTAL